MKIRIGSRQSPLASWQANFIAGQLRELGCEVELVWLVTEGDVTTGPLAQSAGIGVFTKAIQRALLENRCDVAVHSMKDLPTQSVPGLVVAATTQREDVRDCLLSLNYASYADLPSGARVGTGSPRRVAQLRRLRDDIEIVDIRGNVDSRIKKMKTGEYDAILLAAAGLNRLHLETEITQYFSCDEILPAVGQAALGLECRHDDSEVMDVLRRLRHEVSWQAVTAERAVLRTLQAGCLAPMGVHAHWQDARLHLVARLFSADGSRCVEADGHSDEASDDAGEKLGMKLAAQLLARGASDLLV